jgi:hypothetical protein
MQIFANACLFACQFWNHETADVLSRRQRWFSGRRCASMNPGRQTSNTRICAWTEAFLHGIHRTALFCGHNFCMCSGLSGHCWQRRAAKIDARDCAARSVFLGIRGSIRFSFDVIDNCMDAYLKLFSQLLRECRQLLGGVASFALRVHGDV